MAKWSTAVRRALIFMLVWWALAEGSLDRWPFALAMVALATFLSLALLPPPPWRLRWQALPAFVLFFFHQALLGGFDVAWRALHPQLPIKPGFSHHPLQPKPLAARLLLAWTVSLLPGTLSVEIEPDSLEVHSLNTDLSDQALIALETKIDALFVGPLNYAIDHGASPHG